MIEMKRKFFIMTGACLALLAILCFSACNDTIDPEGDSATKSISVVPNPMTVGGTVSLSGPNFGSATEVVFPGNIKVTDFEKFGDQINVVVPASSNRTGNIAVKLSSGDFTIPVDVEIFTTNIQNYWTLDVNPEGLFIAGFDDEVYIEGEGLSSISEAIFPDDVSLLAVNFRKTETKLTLVVPFGVPRDKGILKLVGLGGKVFEIGPMDFSGAPMPEDVLPWLVGDGSKAWTWDFDSGVGGSAWYLGSVGEAGTASWWGGNLGGEEAEGAKMVFSWEKRYSGRLTLLRNDGTETMGKFNLDKDYASPEVGDYLATGRITTNKVTVLFGKGADGQAPNAAVMIYDILKLDEDYLMLAWPNNMVGSNYNYGAGDGCTYWFFKAVK